MAQGNAGRSVRDSTSQDTLGSQVGPWAMVPVWVMSMDLTPGEFKVYVALRSFCDRNGHCFPKMRTVADRANLGISAVRNAVQKLRKLGLLTTAEVRRSADGGLSHLQYRLVDLDPRAWKVEPTGSQDGGTPVTSTSEGSTSGEVPPSLSQVTQEHTSEHPKEDTKELSSCAPSSSSSATPRSTDEDDDERRKSDQKVPQQRKPRLTRAEREERQARTLIVDNATSSYDAATALLTKLRNDGVKYVGAYLAGVVEQDGEEKIAELLDDAEIEYCDWIAERDTAHKRAGDDMADQIAKLRPKMKPEAVDRIRAAYAEARRAGHHPDDLVATMNTVLHGPRSNGADGYLEALEALGVRIAA